MGITYLKVIVLTCLINQDPCTPINALNIEYGPVVPTPTTCLVEGMTMVARKHLPEDPAIYYKYRCERRVFN